MKIKLSVLAVILALAIFSIRGTIVSMQSVKEVKDTLIIKYPSNVKAIVNKKCYQCHCAEAKSQKVKNKLNFDSLSMLSKTSQLSKLDHIIEVMDEGSMPPEKYIARNPDAKLTDNETKVLKEWAKEVSDIIMAMKN